MVAMAQRLTLRGFDRAVCAAFNSPFERDGLSKFFGSLRDLLGVQVASLVLYANDDCIRPFGVHEMQTHDFVPEMELTGVMQVLELLKAPQAVCRSSIISDRDFQATDLYRRYYEPYGLLRQAVRVMTLGGRHAKLVVDRASALPDFDRSELDALDMVADHLERAYRDRNGRIGAVEGRSSHSTGYVAPGIEPPVSFDWSARFGFTPGESRLAASICGGGGMAAAACDLGISINTVKSRLRAIFEKTGTHRQAELILLLLGRRAANLPEL